MKTQLSLVNLLKTQEKDIYIFDRNEKGELFFKNSPQQFISYRTVNFCSDVVETIESEEKLVCKISQVLTQIDTRHMCEIYKNNLPIEILSLSTDDNGDYYTFMNTMEINQPYNKFSFEYLTENFFFIKTSDWDKYLAKEWSKV